MRFKIFGVLAVISTVFFCSSAFAEIQVVARAAAGIQTDGFDGFSSPDPMLSADVTYGMSGDFQLGATYDHNFLSYKGGGSTDENFYGGIARLGFAGPFIDFQAGICSEGGSSTSFSWGAGVGYTTSVSPGMDFGPRFGYRSLPVGGATQSMIDLGLMLTFNFI